jgi:hypothetical protein
VLILAREAVIATLIGMLLELDENYEPTYPANGERAEEALARLRPPLRGRVVVLLDGEMDAAGSDLFFARAARARARVVLFGPPGGDGTACAAAAARALPYCAMPCNGETLAAALSGDGGES